MVVEYFKALWGEWNTRLMGFLSAPLAIGGAFIPDQKWKAASWIVSVAMFVVANFCVWEREYKIRAKLQWQADGFPNIVIAPRGFYTDDRFLGTVGIGGIANFRTQRMNCLLVRFVNDPSRSAASAVASGVTASVTFVNLQNVEICTMDARWGDSGIPRAGQSNIELLSASFNIGQTRELDIAVKLPDDENCWGVNNESFFSHNFQNPALQLSGSDFHAIVRVRGVNIDRSWRLRFRNNGPGRGLEAGEIEDVVNS